MSNTHSDESGLEDSPSTESPTESHDQTQHNESASQPSRKRRSKSLELVETIVVALLLAIFIRATLAEARFIPSGSMIPSLLVGDRLIVEKVSYYFSDPQRGDIVVFYPPDPSLEPQGSTAHFMRWLGFTRQAAYIKRVVGLPGESIRIEEGQVFINGKALEENYTNSAYPDFDNMPAQTIPEDHYFMMGDNRGNSRDSRVWGTLPEDNIIGRTMLRFWPLNRFGMP